MKKIKTINKLLSSLTLLSPLTSIGFNNQYQNTQTVITENYNNSLNNYFSSNTQEKMGDITINVDGTTITGYVEGEGKLVVDSDITEIASNAFLNITDIISLDLSQATSLTTIADSAFLSCSNLTGNLIIPSHVATIGNNTFYGINITSLDLSQATSLTTIGGSAFMNCSNLSGNLVIPSSVTSVGTYAFGESHINNLYFLSETPPTFESNWQPTVTGKVYVPSEQAKQAYLSAPNFEFVEDQVEIGLPSESKSNTGLILGLTFGLGIPIILAAGFGIWYLTKKKKTTIKK